MNRSRDCHDSERKQAAVLPASARLPLVLLLALGTAALFHFCYWLLTSFLSPRL